MSTDQFWLHWREALSGFRGSDLDAVQVNSWRTRAVSVETLSLIPVGEQGRVRVRSSRLRWPKVNVTSFVFDAGPLFASSAAQPAVQSAAQSGAVREVSGEIVRRAPIAPSRRPPAPAGAPTKDRVLAALQPSLASLLADHRLFLPCAPFPYQYEGIQFLSSRWSALLADEMGLGKTMQTVLATRVLLRSGMLRSVLLVCPKPLVSNWVREFRFWAEEIPVKVVGGAGWSRRHAWLHDPCPIKIVNYEGLTRDESLLEDAALSFDLVVLDEAQRIKNHDSKTAKVARRIRRKRSWALTGTPVENHANDLVSLLEFVQQRPVLAGLDPHEPRADLLRDAVGDVLLRRTKEQVLSDLPAKRVHDLYVDLGPAQRARYDAAEKDGVVRLNELGDEITIEHVFELVRRLKQICNYDPATGESAKLEQTRASLEEIADSGRKAILFSQWVETIRFLEQRLEEFRPLVYHGQVSGERREFVLNQFKNDKDRSLLLLSYGTGAVGLNLQFANYCILFDRWWNPAIEDQAINRVHRIGQKEPVLVTRLITPETIEERIATILEKKRELFSYLIDDHESPSSGALSSEEVFGLFDLRVRDKSG